MVRNPPGDKAGAPSDESIDGEWYRVLRHRSTDDGSLQEVAMRFQQHGIAPQQVQAALADGGDALYAAAASGQADWSDAFGGPLAVALIAAEVSALAAQVVSRASGIRALAVAQLLDEYSAVTVAAQIGVARQKVYEVARGGLRPPYIQRVPWRDS
jgi:hypothetical protein